MILDVLRDQFMRTIKIFNLSPNIGHILLPLLFITFSVLYLILAMHLPVTIRSQNVHDDALFWGNAYQIVSGNWLGAYSQMTLAKGPGFPLFLAANAILGTPITLLIALLYLFACALIANTFRLLGMSKYFILIIFAVILFHPALFPLLIIRDNIYPALSLIIISGMIQLLFIRLQSWHGIVGAIPYGFVFGFFWITREEGIWIIPGLIVLFSLKLLQLKKQQQLIKDVFYRFVVFSVIAMLFVSLIAWVNYYNYGKFEVVDFKGQAYTEAVKSLNSVDVGQDLQFIPVSFEKRQEIYRVSPSFFQLKNYFEDKNNLWARISCVAFPWSCGEITGGLFEWALRAAIASKGYYDTPVHAADFYSNITKEIKSACDARLIKCETNPIPLMPNINIVQLSQFPHKIMDALTLAMLQNPVLLTYGPSTGAFDKLQSARLFLGDPLTTLNTSEKKYSVRSEAFYLKLKGLLVKLYKFIIPFIVLLGACSYFKYLILLVIRRVPMTDFFIVSTTMWCLFFSRILLLVMVEVSSFPAILWIYMSAAFPILCLAAFLSIQLNFVRKNIF